MKHSLFLLMAALCSLSCRCGLPGIGGGEIRLMSYNMQNLFDATEQGTEYAEFNPSSPDLWNRDLYFTRLRQFGDVLKNIEGGLPDILFVQEVENAGVLEKLRSDFLQLAGYRYLACPAAPDSAVNVGYLSRFPVISQVCHLVSIPGATSPRYVLEVQFDIRGTSLRAFVCHWKSRRGGAEQTEVFRRAAAAVIRSGLKESPSIPTLVVGDLNESVNEYDLQSGRYRTALMPFDTVTGLESAAVPEDFLSVITDPDDFSDIQDEFCLYSPWNSVSDDIGSYFYRDRWERIDHFLLTNEFFDGSEWEFIEFQVISHAQLIKEDGTPLAWRTSSARGFSDHLPVLITLSRKS